MVAGVAAAAAPSAAEADAAAQPHDGMRHPRLVFPHTGLFKGPGGRVLAADEVQHLLSGQVSDQRLERIKAVVAQRCYSVVPVIEGLHDVGNMSAVCRSADAMGLGSVQCVVSGTKLKQSQRTTAGAEKWLDLRIWRDTRQCLGALKGAGYQIVTTHLDASSVTIQEVDWTRPTAFVLGNEKGGVSRDALEMADAVAAVPMAGFVESFNVSVAAAIIMWEAQQQRVRRQGRHGDLSEREREVLLAEFLIRGVREPALLVEELLSRGISVFDRQAQVLLEAREPPASWRPPPAASWREWVGGTLAGCSRFPEPGAGGSGDMGQSMASAGSEASSSEAFDACGSGAGEGSGGHGGGNHSGGGGGGGAGL